MIGRESYKPATHELPAGLGKHHPSIVFLNMPSPAVEYIVTTIHRMLTSVTLCLTASPLSPWSSWVARLWSPWFWQTMESVPAVPWSLRICSVREWGISKTFRLWLLSNQSYKGSIPSRWRRRLYSSNKMDSRIPPQKQLLSNGMTLLQSWSNVVTQLVNSYFFLAWHRNPQCISLPIVFIATFSSK